MKYKSSKLSSAEIADLQKNISKFISGDLSSAEIKHFTAPFGIYEQKNKKFMVRIRCAAGIISSRQLNSVATISEKYGAKDFHITTRQQLQIHDVNPENIINVLQELKETDMAFRGGGGNTLRNVIASPDSGVSTSEIFDVSAYAIATSNTLLLDENSFKLPRKFKIAFSNSPADNVFARCTDIGFIAAKKGEIEGFNVFVAGGLGRSPQSGVQLHDFIPAEKFLLVAEAVLNLFYKYGNRENRNKARLRFLFNSLGKEKFFKLYYDELNMLTENDEINLPEIENTFEKNIELKEQNVNTEQFNTWKKRYVKRQKQENFFSVELPFLFGNIKNSSAKILADFIQNFGDSSLRFTIDQNILLRNIPQRFLGNVFEISREISPLAEKPKLFANAIVCAGAEICKIGICNPKKIFMELIQKNENPAFDKLQNFKLRFSGCPNSCGQHLFADLGFAGKIKNVNGERKFYYSVFENAELKNNAFRLAEKADEIPEENVCDYIINLLS